MQYSMDSGIWGSVFAVPSAVVDKHLKLAGSVQLKALLWVLRQGCGCFTDDALAQALGVSTADARDALRYWQETGVLMLRTPRADAANTLQTQPADTGSKPTRALPDQAPSENAAQPVPKHRTLPSRAQRPDAAFVAKRMEQDAQVACLMQEAEQILGRLLSPGDMGALLMLHDDFGLPVDVLLMLLQYAAGEGKGNLRYIEKVGLNWADEGVVTHELAEQKLEALVAGNRAWRTVQQALGLPARAPSTREEEYAKTWVLQWQFAPAMLKLAYDRCVDGTGKFSPGYMHKILERWHRNGIASPQQAQQEAFQHKQGKVAAGAPSFDLDAYERDRFREVLGGDT